MKSGFIGQLKGARDGMSCGGKMNNKMLKKCYDKALIYTTKSCNLRCPRCYMDDCGREILSGTMAKEQFRRIIERLKEQDIKIRWMYLTGGESTLWPHLLWAIDFAKSSGHVKKIRVYTNAIDRNAEDYGNADVVYISHYGAINRNDILRLKRQLKRSQFKLQYVVHLPWPFKEVPENNLPSDCGCINLSFVGDRIYPCGMSAAREEGDSISVEDDFQKIYQNGDPRNQDLCCRCLSNRKNKQPNITGLTMEFGVWDSAFNFMWSFKSKAIWLRKIYNYYHFLARR